MKQGVQWHESQSPRHKRRVCRCIEEPVKRKTNVYVRSYRLNIHGYIDELILNDKQCVIVEYKIDHGKPTLAQKLQLVAYHMAAQESLAQDVVASILLKGNARKQYQINLTDDLTSILFNVLSDLNKLLGQHRLPHSSASEAKCTQCEYLRYCNDR